MISCHDLCYSYPHATNPLFSGLHLHIPKGSFTLVAGPNGSGKSTLLLLMAGILRLPKEQKLAVNGATAFLPHDPEAWLLGETVLEDLWLGLSSDMQKHATNLAERFALGSFYTSPTKNLSFGQKRKLCLASALSADPPILLLDEPLTGLDYLGICELRHLLQDQTAKGRTIIISTNDVDPLADLSDALVLLHKEKAPKHLPLVDSMPLLKEYGVRPPSTWLSGGILTPWA